MKYFYCKWSAKSAEQEPEKPWNLHAGYFQNSTGQVLEQSDLTLRLFLL